MINWKKAFVTASTYSLIFAGGDVTSGYLIDMQFKPVITEYYDLKNEAIKKGVNNEIKYKINSDLNELQQSWDDAFASTIIPGVEMLAAPSIFYSVSFIFADLPAEVQFSQYV